MILADSGYWVGLLSPRDQFHAATLSAEVEVRDEGLVTTWPVVTEVCFLIRRDNDEGRVSDFLAGLQEGDVEIHDFPKDAVARMERLMRKYRSWPMDLADASLIVLAEDLDEGRILTTDREEFDTYRWKKNRPFRNLLPAG